MPRHYSSNEEEYKLYDGTDEHLFPAFELTVLNWTRRKKCKRAVTAERNYITEEQYETGEITDGDGNITPITDRQKEDYEANAIAVDKISKLIDPDLRMEVFAHVQREDETVTPLAYAIMQYLRNKIQPQNNNLAYNEIELKWVNTKPWDFKTFDNYHSKLIQINLEFARIGNEHRKQDIEFKRKMINDLPDK